MHLEDSVSDKWNGSKSLGIANAAHFILTFWFGCCNRCDYQWVFNQIIMEDFIPNDPETAAYVLHDSLATTVYYQVKSWSLHFEKHAKDKKYGHQISGRVQRKWQYTFHNRNFISEKWWKLPENMKSIKPTFQHCSLNGLLNYQSKELNSANKELSNRDLRRWKTYWKHLN